MEPQQSTPNNLASPEQLLEKIPENIKGVLEVLESPDDLSILDNLRRTHDDESKSRYKSNYRLIRSIVEEKRPLNPNRLSKEMYGSYKAKLSLLKNSNKAVDKSPGFEMSQRIEAMRSTANQAAERSADNKIRNEIIKDIIPRKRPDLADDSDEFHEAEDALFRAAKLDDDDWYGEELFDDDGRVIENKPGIRDALADVLESRQNRANSPEPTEEERIERLEQKRTAKHEAFVRRMRNPIFLGRKRKEALRRDYEDAEREYMVALTLQNQREVSRKREELEGQGRSGDELEQDLKTFASRRANDIQREDQERQHRLMVEKSGSMGKFLEWYGNKATTSQKVLFGVGLGALSLAGGVGVGLAAGMFGGLLGAGIATGAAYGLTRSWGAARTYQLRMAELYKSPDHRDRLEFGDEDSIDSLHLKQRKFFEETSQKQFEQGDRVKKRAVLWSVGSVAVGGLVGVGAHMLTDSGLVHLPGGQVQHWLAEKGIKLPGDHTGEAQGGGKSLGSAEDLPGRRSGTVEFDSPKHRGVLTEHPGGGQNGPDGDNKPEFDPLPRKSVDLWKGAPTEHVLQKLRPDLGDRDAYLRINELYDKFGSKGVFEGATLSEYEPNNIWINENSGTVRLTSQAQEYLNNLHGGGSTPTTGEDLIVNPPPKPELPPSSDLPELPANTDQTINQLTAPGAEATPANIVGGNEGWYQTFTELRQARVMDLAPAKYEEFLKDAGPRLAKIYYGDNTPVAYWDRYAREWRMNSSPDGRLHSEAIRIIARLARRSDYDLAA